MARLVLLLLAALTALAGEPFIPPPLDPASGPLPAGLRLSLNPARSRHRLGEAVSLALMIEAGPGPPIPLLLETTGGDLREADLTLTAADGTVVRRSAEGRTFSYRGAALLAPGERTGMAVRPRLDRCPAGPGRCTVSLFIDLGWGPERPGDPRRVSAEIEWVEPTAAEARDIVERQFALPDGTAQVSEAGEITATSDLDALARPVFLPELLRRVRSGDLRALDPIALTPGPEAVQALIALAQADPPLAQTRADGSPSNLGCRLISRLAEHLPPRRLPGESAWWEEAGSAWRRDTMAGVGGDLLAPARSVGLAWLERSPEASEVLQWTAGPGDRPALLAACARLIKPVAEHQHNDACFAWRTAYAALLADPSAPAPDPRASDAEAVLWCCRLRNWGEPLAAAATAELSRLLAHPHPLIRQAALWALPKPIPQTFVVTLVGLIGQRGDPAAEVVSSSAMGRAGDSGDARVTAALLAAAADPAVQEDYLIEPILRARGLRLAYAEALVRRIQKQGGQGADALRRLVGLCLDVRLVMVGTGAMPTAEQWQLEAGRWSSWLQRNRSRLEPAVLPAGDPAQPDHLLPATWWFEAADGRRFFTPPADL